MIKITYESNGNDDNDNDNNGDDDNDDDDNDDNNGDDDHLQAAEPPPLSGIPSSS